MRFYDIVFIIKIPLIPLTKEDGEAVGLCQLSKALSILFNFLCIFSVLTFPDYLSAQSGRTKVEEGNRLYKEEKYDEALNKYKDASLENPTAPEITFNTGNIYYKKKNYEEALKHYDKASSAQDIKLQSEAYYNTGNALFKSGKVAESILAYKRALELNPADMDIKFNLEYARAFLKENAKKEPQQQQQQESVQKDQKENDDKKNKQDEQKQKKQQSAEQKNEQQDNKDKKDQQQQQPQPKDQMSKEQAEQILRALQSNEKEDLKNAKKQQIPGDVQVLKDW